jgi:hypothetical protein
VVGWGIEIRYIPLTDKLYLVSQIDFWSENGDNIGIGIRNRAGLFGEWG